MILEKTRRLIVQDKKAFTFGPDDLVNVEGATYPGDKGHIYDLSMTIGERPVRILLLDSEFGRKSLLTGRFIYGEKARRLYRTCSATAAKALMRYFPDVMGYVEKAREHQILRAGRVMTLAPYIRGLKTQGDDFKRKPSESGELFQAVATKEINWGDATTRIFSDVCPASGSTMEAFAKKALAETKLEKLIFHCSTSAINSLYRVIPRIPSRVEVTFITWEALYSVYRKDITLPDGQTIHAGTVINVNPDDEFPHLNPIAPLEVINLLHEMFQKDRIGLMPDVPGEVGEKIQDNHLEPLTYDFLEFVNAGVDLGQKPWFEKAAIAWHKPGVAEHLREKAPAVYAKLADLFCGKYAEERAMKVNVPVK